MERTWTDQPEELTDTDILFSGHINEQWVEVRSKTVKVDMGQYQKYYFTIGSLFGSQTLECDDAGAVFRAMNMVPKSNSKIQLKCPIGCKLMDEVSNGQ